MIEPTEEMRRAFLAEREDSCGVLGCGRADCLNIRLSAVLAIVERDMAGPCSVRLANFVRDSWLDCQLRHGHAGDHECGPTRWKEIGS